MEGSQVTFGRRGVPKVAERAAAEAAHTRASVSPHIPSHVGASVHDIRPNRIVERSASKIIMYMTGIWLVIFLTAGMSKHSNDLPYWLRPYAEFHIRNYLLPFIICSVVTLFTLGPALRRPVALRLYDDHFDFIPLIGATRQVYWSMVGNISESGYRYKHVRVEVAGERRVTIYTAYLSDSRSNIAEMLEYARRNAALRHLHLSGEPIDGRYLFPGH